MKSSKKSVLSFFGFYVIITLTVTFVLINNSDANLAYSGESTDPSMIPIPEFDFDDPAKAMVVTVFFNGDDVVFKSAHVSSGRAPALIGNPPLLLAQIMDEEGILLEEFNYWHPLLIEQENKDGTFSWITLDSGLGHFIFPFTPNLGSMKLIDVGLNKELISVDLTAPIREFCQENPKDPDCLVADLEIKSVNVIDSPPVTIEKSSYITTQTVMKNNGPNLPMDAILSQIVTFPSEVLVTPVETTEEEVSLSDKDRPNKNTYSIQCLEPGFHTLVFTSKIDALHAAVSDPDKSNNESVIEHKVDCNIKPKEEITVYRNYARSTISPSYSKSVYAYCDSGDVATGGSGYISQYRGDVLYDYPLTKYDSALKKYVPYGWAAKLQNTHAKYSTSGYAYVVCGDNTDTEKIPVYRNYARSTISPSYSKSVYAYCDSGDVATGGSGYISQYRGDVLYDYPLTKYDSALKKYVPYGWAAKLQNTHTKYSTSGYAYVVCGDNTDTEKIPVYRNYARSTISPSYSKSVYAYCDSGDVATGGSGYISQSRGDVLYDYPLTKYDSALKKYVPYGWAAKLQNTHTKYSTSGYAYVVCGDNTP